MKKYCEICDKDFECLGKHFIKTKDEEHAKCLSGQKDLGFFREKAVLFCINFNKIY
jgi:hypothetical protein